MKRKISVLVLAIALFVTGCGTNEDIIMNNENEVNIEVDVELNNEIEAVNEEVEETDEELIELVFQDLATIEEKIIVDQEDVVITATDLIYTDYDVSLNISIENKSEKEIEVITNSGGYAANSVNGYMINDGYINSNVLPGKKSNESISFSKAELMILGITEIADIEIGFRISDTETYDSVNLEPVRVETSEYANDDYGNNCYQELISSGYWEVFYDIEIDEYEDEVIYEQANVKIISTAKVKNKDEEEMILFEVVNDSEELVYFASNSLSINDVLLYDGSISYDAINPGCHRIVDVSLSDYLDEEKRRILGIPEIQKISLNCLLGDKEYVELADEMEVELIQEEELDAIDIAGMDIYDNNGIKIIYKGFIDELDEDYGDLDFMFLVENNYEEEINISDVNDSFSFDGYMEDASIYSIDIKPERYALWTASIDGDDLEKYGVESAEDITEIEFLVLIRNEEYDELDESSVKIEDIHGN